MQHDYSLDNQPGAAFRGDLNDALQALVGQSSGDTAPAVTYPFMWWMDTANSQLKQRNAGNTAWITVAAITVDGWSPYYQGQEFVDYISGNLTWQVKAIGEPFALRDDLPGVATPPTDSEASRFIKLTAGEAGFGLYNEGVLINETITGSAPLITATAEINLAESPLHGQTVNLINTERRFVRAGESGMLQDDAFQGHFHEIETRTEGSGTSSSVMRNGDGVGPVTDSDHMRPFYDSDGTNGTPRTDDETRPRSIGATYYMRIL